MSPNWEIHGFLWTAALGIMILMAFHPTAASHDVTWLLLTPSVHHYSACFFATRLDYAGVVEALETGTCWCITMFFSFI